MSKFCKHCKRNVSYSGKLVIWKNFTFCNEECRLAYSDQKNGIREIIGIKSLIYPAVFGLASGCLGFYGLFSGRAFMPDTQRYSHDSFWVTREDPWMYWTVVTVELGLFLFMVIACTRHYLKNKHKIRFENE